VNSRIGRRLANRTPRLQTLATATLLGVIVVAAIVLYQQRSPSPAAVIPSRTVTAMHFFSPSEGWVLSQVPGPASDLPPNVSLLVTRDGGAHWRNVTPGPPEPPLHTVVFLDPARGWAATVGGFSVPTQTIRIFRTTDGGGAWTSSQVEVESAFDVSLDFVDAQYGWLVVSTQLSPFGGSGELFQTADGGATWNPLPSPPSGHPVRFLNLATGWSVGGAPFNKLYITHNGGHTWQPQTVPIPPAYAGTTPLLLLPTLVDARHGVLGVIFADGSVLLDFTDDGGATWSMNPRRAPLLIRQPPYARNENVVAPTYVSRDLIAVVLGMELKLQVGSSWLSIRPRGLDSASEIEYVNPRVGWARSSYPVVCPGSKGPCDWHGDLLRTTDGGLTWEPVQVR
jgi:photosystem II stability/assembly factor-like uncharacterized protein